MEEHMVDAPIHFYQPVLLHTNDMPNQIFSLNMNEVKDGMKWMNDKMKSHAEEGLKSEECWWDDTWEKWESQGKPQKF